MFKLLILWRKIPKEIKTALIWIVTEIVAALTGKRSKKKIKKLLIGLIKKTDIPKKHKEFMVTFLEYIFNDGRLDRRECLDLVSLLFDIQGIPIKVSESTTEITIMIRK